MKFKLPAAVLLAVAACSASTISIVGFEDGTDFDYNDTVITVTNILFHATGSWSEPVPNPTPSEPIFPGGVGFFFDTAMATGPVLEIQDFQATADTERVYIEIGAGPWNLITGSSVTLAATAGDTVHFRLDINGFPSLYPAAGLNADGKPHAVEQTLAPEPGTLLMMAGAALILIGRWRK
jgi:hypothetical protein